MVTWCWIDFGSGYREVRGSRLFTASGMQYFHVFNISLCGKEPVNCANNITFQSEGESKSVNSFRCYLMKAPLPRLFFSRLGHGADLPDDVDSVSESGRFRQLLVDSVGYFGRPSDWYDNSGPSGWHPSPRGILERQGSPRLLRHSHVNKYTLNIPFIWV